MPVTCHGEKNMKLLKLNLFPIIVVLLTFGLSNAEPILIANPSVTLSSLSKDAVNLIFLGKQQKWDDDQKIFVATLKRGEVHTSFLETYINKTPSKYSSFWKLAIVAGTGYPPKAFETEAELITYVAGKKGAIGYISSETPHDAVNVITIE